MNESEISSELVLDGLIVTAQGLLEFDGDVFPNTMTSDLKRGERQGFEFDALAGGRVTIAMQGAACGAPDTFLFLFGPEDEVTGDRGPSIAQNDDAFLGNCTLNSQITNFLLPERGTYLIVATSFNVVGGGRYTLQLRCTNARCKDPEAASFAKSREFTQARIEAREFDALEVFENGDFLFEHIYRLSEGFGNALIGSPAGNRPRPNMRDVHEGAFGSPEAVSCLDCHNQGANGRRDADDGAGGNDRNIFQIGDGVNKATGLQRNAPHLLGLGFREIIARDMSTVLKGQRDAGIAAARAANANRTVTLTANGVSFGSLIARPDGTVDTAGVRGVDADLVIKTFGWKFRESLLRRFVEGGFRVHFGMQTQPSILRHCQQRNDATFGTGANCLDPDADGVQEEISEGQLTSMAVYMALLDSPTEIPGQNAAENTLIARGRSLFTTVGCASCHVPFMDIPAANVVFNEPSDSGGPGFNINVKTETEEPRPQILANGAMRVVAYSDYKRHDMGTALADFKNFGIIAGNQFGTTPLWALSNTAPYLHDGRAPSIRDAIVQHAGEGLAARNAFVARSVADQLAIIRFLKSLGRGGDTPPPERVDISGFEIFEAQTGITVFFTSGTGVPHGGYAVVGRNATKAQFEAFWGVVLPANVSYFNSNGFMPIISGGGATFRLRNADGITIDGPTIAMPTGGRKNIRRTNVDGAAGLTASWTVATDATTNATPGGGQPLGNGVEAIYISEFSDASNANFEFIELFVE